MPNGKQTEKSALLRSQMLSMIDCKEQDASTRRKCEGTLHEASKEGRHCRERASVRSSERSLGDRAGRGLPGAGKGVWTVVI